jgi:hypothetical protein
VNTAPMRAFLGCVAGAISVLVFQQGMWSLLHATGLMVLAPYPTRPVAPFNVPQIADLCFWGAVYGALFGLFQPRVAAPRWLCGLGLGFITALIGWFVVLPLKGMPAANGWVPAAMARFLVLNLTWGIGVALILPLLKPRMAVQV